MKIYLKLAHYCEMHAWVIILEHADEGTILLKVAIILVLIGGADVRFTFAIRRRRRFRENGIN